MSQKTRAQLKTGIDTNYPDNTSGAIKPLNDRTQHIDEVDSALNLIETANQTVTGLVNYLGGLNVNGLPVVVGLITISEADQFTNQDATDIFLESNKIYIVVASFSIANKEFIFEDGGMITALNQFGATITHTGSGSMFNGVDVTATVRQIRLDCPLAKTFDFTDNVGGVKFLICIDVTVLNCAKWGSFNNMRTIEFTNSSGENSTQGADFTGSSTLILSADKFALVSSSAAFIGLDLGTMVAPVIELNDLFFIAPLGAVGIKGAANSANIPVGSIATVSGCTFIGGMTEILQGIDPSDIRWGFLGNSPIPDSVNEADLYLTGGAETITTGSAGDWQEIGTPSAGGVSWASDIASRFTVGSDGIITYIGERPICIRISGRATVEKDGGGSDVIEVRFAKNWDGTASDSGIEKSRAQTQNTAPTSVPIGALVDLVTGNDIRVIFSNVTGASDIIANVSAVEIA